MRINARVVVVDRHSGAVVRCAIVVQPRKSDLRNKHFMGYWVGPVHRLHVAFPGAPHDVWDALWRLDAGSEGTDWARGWNGRRAHALRALAALE